MGAAEATVEATVAQAETTGDNFYRATAVLSAVYAVVVCLSVCVCVCHTPILYQNG